ncbi:hypothetical protein PsYK624_122800 [Phanerochaete sordida]|uniref:F-box domain-containing protein n=1 Tax=Phanerochaete sordida TaxID=48140 RepID=A0A9P3LJC8_9APHY|nr:hypothetical protein PsYK624_122800 [Phanerochaete sordida]
MRTIPVELQDCVLDNLRGSRAILVNCTLVCRAWRRRARFNLFHTIQIDWAERRRTTLLLEVLLETHSLVRDLTLTSAAYMQPEELVGLLEALENLESLSILAHRRNSGLLHLLFVISAHPVLGERLLAAIARMEKLRALDFTPRGLLYSWAPQSTLREDGPALSGTGLSALSRLDGDMFPAQRAHRLWTAIAAAKALDGAAPLTHFGTAVHSLQPLSGFIAEVGAQLQSLRLDLRAIFLAGEDTISSFRTSGLSLSHCKNLRTLTMYLEAPSTRDNGNINVCAALLSTAGEDVPLVRINITLYHLSRKFFMLPSIAESAEALDESIVGLPHLKRVDWHLAHCVPDDDATSHGGKTQLADMFAELFPELATQTKGVKVNWKSDMEKTRGPQIGAA